MLELLNRPIKDLDQLTVPDLRAIQDQLAQAEATLKTQKAIFVAAMERRFGEKARAAYAEQKKLTGTIKFPVTNTTDLRIEVDKTVVWDQGKTMEWLNKQTIEDANHYGKLKVEIPEAKYKAAPPNVQAQLKPFRTVKPGKMKFSFVNVELKDDETGEVDWGGGR